MAVEDLTQVTARDPNIENDVRAMVQRIVDGLFQGDEMAVADAPSDGRDHAENAAAGGSDEVATVAIGADHGGFALKERLGFRLKEQGYDVVDCGTDSTEAVDYPDFAHAVATAVASGRADVGIMVDGAGIGSAMVGNKVPGVRAALCYDLSTARNAREHNHATMLTLGAGLIGDALAWQITQEFIATSFGSGRHANRVAKIDVLDHDHVGSSR
jgi:ribose 5-phosphate isomerase B